MLFRSVLEDVQVPLANRLGNQGQGLAIALKGITEFGRSGIAGIAVGLMEAALEAALKFANERVLYGKPIANLQAIQFKIADMHADLEASRLMLHRACWLLDQNKRADLEMASAKLFCTEAVLRCTRLSMEIMGGYGCMKEYQVERYLRDAQLLWPGDGTNDIQRIVIGRTLTAAARKK